MLSRRGWVVLLTVLAVVGVVLRWHWLEALSLTSIVLSFVPCLSTCELGLCVFECLAGPFARSFCRVLRPSIRPRETVETPRASSGNGASSERDDNIIDPILYVVHC